MDVTTLLPFATAFGFALFHSLWMGALLYVLVRTIAPLLPNTTSRYALAYLALWALFVGVGYAFYDGYYVASICENVLVQAQPTGSNAILGVTQLSQVGSTGLSEWLSPVAPWFSLLYALGLVPACCLLFRAQARINRLKHEGLRDLPAEWTHGLDELLAAHPLTRSVKVALSAYASEVMTLGFWSPVIVFPIALANNLSPAMARTLLMHEIAHIRRMDHLLNYPQQIIRVLFFYHPAVHALCRFIDREREHRCDDWVTNQGQDRQVYASALVTVARHFNTLSTSQNPLAMSATKTPFASRIHRLFSAEKTPKSGQFALSVLVFALLGIGHFSYSEAGAAAGAEVCWDEKSEVVLYQAIPPEPLLKLPEPILEEAAPPTLVVEPEVNEPIQKLTPAPAPPISLSTFPAPAPAAAPLLTSFSLDTIAPEEFKITDEDRRTQHVDASEKGPLAERKVDFLQEEGLAVRINGKLSSPAGLKALDPDKIGSMKVYKGAEKVEEFGLHGYTSLIDIYTKGYQGTAASEEKNGTKIRIGGDDPDRKTAWFVNDTQIIPGTLDDLDANLIASVSVVKDELPEALSRQGYDSAVYIVTKRSRDAKKFLKKNGLKPKGK